MLRNTYRRVLFKQPELDNLHFSENGFHLLVSKTKSTKAQIWDLRPNYQKSVKDFEFDKPIEALAYDKTGRYVLFVAGDLHLVDGSKFNLLASIKESFQGVQTLK